jgi:hypothetical protein
MATIPMIIATNTRIGTTIDETPLDVVRLPPPPNTMAAPIAMGANSSINGIMIGSPIDHLK